MAILALVGRAHLATQRVHHELQPITDAEHGHAQFEHARIGGGSIFVVHRPGRPRQNDSSRRIALHLIKLGRTRQHDGKNILFADATRDQLGILRAKIENDDGLTESRLAESLLVRGLGFHK